MKQRISVRAIIRSEERTLLLRRARGNPELQGQYELPGGSLGAAEQPEDAVRRHVGEQLGVSVRALQLFDVLTYVDDGNRDTQTVFIVYLVYLEPQSRLVLGDVYSKYLWARRSSMQTGQLTAPSQLLLNISHQKPEYINSTPVTEDKKTTDFQHLTVYSDGGSRGNPGPSAAGFVVMDYDGQVQDQGGVYLGITTNNQAEYHGVRLGLERALELGATTVDFRMDSLLVVNQMNGVYTIKNRELWPIHERIRTLVGQFEKVTFSHVKREFNQLADGVVNKLLDQHMSEVDFTERRVS